MDVESVAVVVLLDFLMGGSIEEVTHQHRLPSTSVAEALLRAALLRHGYGAHGRETAS